MLPTKFRFIWPNGFRGEELKKSANQKQESPMVAMFVNGSGRNEQSLQRTFHGCFLPSFGSFGQAVSEEKIFKNRPIRNKNGLWWPCLLMDRYEMSNLYRGPSIDASFSSFGWGVSEEKIKIWKFNGRQTTDTKWWQKLTLPLARWTKNNVFRFLRVWLLNKGNMRCVMETVHVEESIGLYFFLSTIYTQFL